MKLEVKVPSVGESVTTAEIESWEKQSGDFVKKGDILVILETDKASMEVPAEKEGQLTVLKNKGETVSVDEVIAFIETEARKADQGITQKGSILADQSLKEQRIFAREEWEELEESKKRLEQEIQDIKTQADSKYPHNNGLKVNAEKLYQKVRELEKRKDRLGEDAQIAKKSWNKLKERNLSKSPDLKKDLSPAVRRLIETESLDPSEVEGTGRGGRLTKEDILKVLNKKPEIQASNESNIFEKNSNQKPVDFLKKGQKREPMTRLRRITAERLVQSQHNTATLSTFNEVDLSRIIEIRKNYQADFVKKYAHKLGFMSFFVKSVVSALKEYPKINAFIDGEDIIYNDCQHIGIAVSTEKGLVVPVLFNAEILNLAQIEKKIIEYRDKALSKKLTPDDLLGGTFTISNGGVFGSLLSTPILNPPQSGILGMHKIEERPVVRDGKIEIRPMMYLTLSYDHRVVDGRESVGFLVKVKEGLEEPARLLIDL